MNAPVDPPVCLQAAPAPVELTLATALSRLGSVVAQALEDDHLVLDLQTGRYFALGPVGGFLWERLGGSRTLAELAEEVEAEFAAGEQVREDVLRFAAELLALGLAVSAGSPAE